MANLKKLLRQVKALVFGAKVHQEIDEELNFHQDLRTEENIRRGMPPEEARRAARQRFGNQRYVKDLSWDVRGGGWLESLWQDVRYGSRMLRKNRAFSIVVVAIFALGMGASTSLFSLIDGCLIHNSTFPTIDRWFAVRAYLPQQNVFSNRFSVPELVEVKRFDDVFEQIGAIAGVQLTLTGGDYPEQISGTNATRSAFIMTGLQPLLGRIFNEDEDRPGGPAVTILSYELWQRRYFGKPDILGEILKLDNQSYRVIGVMPPNYDLWGGDLWLPFQLNPSDPNRLLRRFWIITLIRPGASESQANARLSALSRQLEQQFGSTNPEYKGMQLSLWSLREALVSGIRPALLVLLAAIALLLLICCANVGNLMLVRATGRKREMTIRLALGASRFRLIRQMLVECLLLSTTGGIAGVLLSIWLLPTLVHLIPGNVLSGPPEFIRVNYRIMLAMTGLSVLTGLLFGIAPALQATRSNISDTLKAASQKLSSDFHGRFARNSLVVAEIALAIVVLVGAGLMMKSYRELQGIDLGFKPDHVVGFNLELSQRRYATGQQIGAFYQELIKRLDALPGSVEAATVSGRPLGMRMVDVAMQDVNIEGRPVQDGRASANANYRMISPDFFKVMGIPLRRGRLFTDQDNAQSPRVAIINETMARLYWPKSDPIGQRMRLGTRYNRPLDNFAAGDDPYTVIGVVADSKQIRVIDAPIRQEFYVPQLQRAEETRVMSVVVRSALDPAQLTPAIRQVAASIDPEQPINAIDTMDKVIADSFGPKRLTMLLLGFFAAVAMILSAIGLYAILAYSVSQRTQEIGIRIALGAQTSNVLKLVFGQAMKLIFIGIALGLGSALALTRLMTNLLYGVSATDPATFVEISLLLIAVAFLASYIPARRAAKVDPLVALRAE